ncbi:MAG TPA: all-trans-retinol 13,14-reductase [Candidatus Rokubacteria bacterium]|nr:MAG: all-trans-retinol 13,14-reductase [Candidatus Rokubacteria bacterium GWA2_73_35]HBH01579.1 all-trans-retinol 13,14-reductase [Candidatus Rokubacteria bacterium]
MARILAGFLPWIAYGALAGAGLTRAAVLAGLGLAALLCGVGLWRRRVKTLEVAALAFFVAAAGLSAALGPAALLGLDTLLANGALAAVAWGTLAARAPFTAEYAREDWPPPYWTSPLFRRLNLALTAVWGAVFTVNAGLGAVALSRPTARVWLALAVPQLLVAGGVAASVVLPRWLPRRWAAGQIAAREPYRWPAPTFGGTCAGNLDGHDVIVVGAGIGGLTAAALLADRGLRVLVLEQHYLAGGFCTSWPRLVRRGDERLRYVFDAGVHDVSGLGPRGPVRHLLATLGLEDRLDWRRVGHEYVLPGLRLKVPERAADFAAALGERFPAERAALRAFFAEMEAVYRELYADVESTGGVPRPPASVEAMLAYPATHPHAIRWMDVPFTAMLDAHLREPKLRELLMVLSGYLSDRPERLTAGAMAPIFGYYFDGGFYPRGGSQALADALVAAIRERGGEIRLRTAVERILIEGRRVTGVALRGGRVERAAAVVSNADARRTFCDLVGAAALPAEFARRACALEPSASAFSVFLGVDYVPDVEPLTMLFADGRGLGIAIPSKVDSGLAPAGHSSVSLITLVPAAEAAGWDRKAPGYALRRRREGDALVALAERALPGLGAHIVYRQDASPATFARYAWTTGGAIYGPALGQGPPPAKTPIAGLVLAGAGVFPGAGVEAVVISGVIAAEALRAGGASDALATSRAA